MKCPQLCQFTIIEINGDNGIPRNTAARALFWNVHAMGCIQLQLYFATLTNNKCMIKHLTTSIASIL